MEGGDVQRERDAEQDKIDGIEELKKKLEEERFGKEQQVYATISEERKEALAKEEVRWCGAWGGGRGADGRVGW